MTPTTLDQRFCVRITSSTTAVSGNVTINLSSAQRPTAGWTTSTIVRSVVVTVITPAGAPTISCVNANQNGFNWPAVTGAENYTIFSSGAQAGTYLQVGGSQTTRTYMPVVGGNSTTFWRVVANSAGGASGFSNKIRIIRSGSSYTCMAVAP